MSSSDHYEALSPVQVEQKLRHCVTELTRAERELRTARDAETEAEIHYKSVYRKAILSADCPKVVRGGTTTAERDAWVDQQCEGDWQALRIAQARREAAQDHLRVQRDIATAVQSVGALVRSAYSVAGQTS